MDWNMRIMDNELIFENDAKETLGRLKFEVEEDTFVIVSTRVNESLRGHGMASHLMEEFCQYAKEKNKKIRPVCSYAVAWLEEKQGNE